jgi:RHS repeat-associated protein
MVSAMNLGNGHSFSQTLTARQQPLRVRSVKGGTTALDLTYTYDPRGLVTAIADAADSANSRAYSYDGLGQLISAAGPWGSGSYTYDSIGNLRSKTLGSRTVTLRYDGRNRVDRSTDTGGSGMPNTGTRIVGYDHRGNVTQLGGLLFDYDYSDQPVTVTGTANGNYRYDGNLKRVRAQVDGKTSYNVYDLSGTLVHVKKHTGWGAEAGETDYVRGPSGTLARITNNVVTYLHNDHLGSASAATTTSGAIAWTERYTPFGEALNKPSVNDDLAGFTGHIRDSATGLNYMQARYQDPVMGRFLSVDPVTFMDTGDPGQFNRYAYAFNDPISHADPDGEVARLVVGVYRVGKRTIKSRGNLKGAIKDEIASIADNGSTLIDPNASAGEKLFAAFDLVVGLGEEAKAVGKAAEGAADALKAKRTARAGCSGCFVAGTLVDTEDGLRPIETLEVGDQVWAKDELSGNIALKPITDLIRPGERQVFEIDASPIEPALSVAASELSATTPVSIPMSRFDASDDHPWWVEGQGWLRTDELASGMTLVARDNRRFTINRVTLTDRVEDVFNITVAGYHTYFVGEDRIWVHNNCDAGLPTNPDDLLDKGYKETSHPKAAAAGHRSFENPETGDKLRFDKGKSGQPGHGGNDHYHRENPNSTGKQDAYLDKNGDPCARGSCESHLYPGD